MRALRFLSTAAKPILRDVVIVGGGPAGLSLMAAIKNNPRTQHLSCTLVEGGSLELARNFLTHPPPAYSNRIVSLTPKSMKFMEEKSGSWEFLNEDRVKLYDNMIAYDSQDPDARIHFDATNIYTPDGSPLMIAAMCEVLHIQSSLLEKIDALNEEFDEEDRGQIIDNAKVVNIEHGSDLDWPIVSLSTGESFQARLLVGADGQNSPVRKFADIESRGWEYGRWGVVGTLKLRFSDYRDIAWQRFLSTGPVAILPLKDDNATFVWSCTPELADIITKVDEAIFPHLLNAAMTLEEVDLNYIYKCLQINPLDALVIEDIQWRTSKIPIEALEDDYPVPVGELTPGSRARFMLKMLHTDTYIAPRIALVGDAAHTVHPLAGQGLNMGQTDVASLVSAIEIGVDRGLDIGLTLVLERYFSEAWPANHALIGICDKLHKIFSTDFKPVVLIRGLGLKTLNMLDGVKELMIKSISAN